MSNFSDQMIQRVWEKAKIVDGYDKDVRRKDYAGAWINRQDYGKESDFGWEIDHAKPKSKGGSEDLNNLDPLHSSNNRTKSDDYPKFKTSVSSEGDKNVEKEQSWNWEA
jgi:5-methylcytosine-specific restriction endonuclease McrA